MNQEVTMEGELAIDRILSLHCQNPRKGQNQQDKEI